MLDGCLIIWQQGGSDKMGRIMMSLMILFAIQASMFLFLGIEPPALSLYEAIVGLEAWSNLNLIDYVSGALVGVGLGIAVAGLATGREYLIYLGIAGNFFGWGASYYELMQRMISRGWLGSGENVILIGLFFAPFIIAWILIILEFARGRD